MEDWKDDSHHPRNQHRGGPRSVGAHNYRPRRNRQQLRRLAAGRFLVMAACSASLVVVRLRWERWGDDLRGANNRPHGTDFFFSNASAGDRLAANSNSNSNNNNLRVTTTARATEAAPEDVAATTAAAAAADGSVNVRLLQQESAEATDRAAATAAELVDALDAARAAAGVLHREAAAAAHKKRVADRAARAGQQQQPQQGGAAATAATSEFASVRERRVQLRDGTEASFSVFGRSDEDVSVFVLPFNTQTKRFRLIEEYHPGPDRRTVGLVAGMYEAKHGGSPETAARWELSEEARLKVAPGVSRLVPLAPRAEGGFSQDKYSSAHFRPFLALDCVDDDRPRPRDKEEDSIRLHDDVSAEDLRRMVQEGKLNVPSTAFALMGLQWLEEEGLLV